MKKSTEATISIPEKVEIKVELPLLSIKGQKGEVKKNISNPKLKIEVKDKNILVTSPYMTKREKKLVNTYAAHVRNMIKGVTEGHKYILKVCSSHFPMNVAVNNNQLIIKNFIGEKFPRTLDLKQGVDVKIEGDKINVESVDKELAGITASDIEQLTRRPGFDRRIFQDGIYIIEKDGKAVK
jgi:large subunit ribosomal protein L6